MDVSEQDSGTLLPLVILSVAKNQVGKRESSTYRMLSAVATTSHN